MDITQFIPVGHQNAVTRQMLCMLTGMSDRQVRDMIADARRDTPILNVQNGFGYYIPDINDPADMIDLKRFVDQETHRLKSIGWSLKAARDMAKGLSG